MHQKLSRFSIIGAVVWFMGLLFAAGLYAAPPEGYAFHSYSPASGAGEQTNPSIFLDDLGNLHLAWVERVRPGAPTRIWYALGRRIIE